MYRLVQSFLILMLAVSVVGCENMKRTSQQKTTEKKAPNMEVAEDIANSVRKVSGVEKATAIKMGNQAYVAVLLKEKTGNGKISEVKKKQISDKAKSVDSTLENVYVSENPDLMKQFEDFGRDVRDGKPIQGLTKSLMDAIQRVFPEAK